MKKWKTWQKALAIALAISLPVGFGACGWAIEHGDIKQLEEQAYSAGWNDGGIWGINQALVDTYDAGYDAGYALGYEEGSDAVDCVDNYQAGYTAGYSAGQDTCSTCPPDGNGGNGVVDNWPGKKTEKPGNPNPNPGTGKKK